MQATLIAGPAAEPLTLAQAKNHLRVDASEDDALITALLVAAREQAEFLLGQRLVTQTWQLQLKAGEQLSLEGFLPIRSITATSSYALTPHWPPVLSTAADNTISITCGFGDAQAVPQSIKQWMLLRIGGWYEQRESLVAMQWQDASHRFADVLLDAWRVPRC